LTGQLPFDGANAIVVVRKHLDADRPDPGRITKNAPNMLNLAIMQLMDKDPAKRFPSAAALIQRLESIQTVGPGPRTLQSPAPGPMAAEETVKVRLPS